MMPAISGPDHDAPETMRRRALPRPRRWRGPSVVPTNLQIEGIASVFIRVHLRFHSPELLSRPEILAQRRSGATCGGRPRRGRLQGPELIGGGRQTAERLRRPATTQDCCAHEQRHNDARDQRARPQRPGADQAEDTPKDAPLARPISGSNTPRIGALAVSATARQSHDHRYDGNASAPKASQGTAAVPTNLQIEGLGGLRHCTVVSRPSLRRNSICVHPCSSAVPFFEVGRAHAEAQRPRRTGDGGRRTEDRSSRATAQRCDGRRPTLPTHALAVRTASSSSQRVKVAVISCSMASRRDFTPATEPGSRA